MIVVLSQFRVAGEMAAAVKEAFLERPHLVDDCRRLPPARGAQPARSARRDLAVHVLDGRGEFPRLAPQPCLQGVAPRIPKGLKVIPRSAAIRVLEHVAE